MQSIQRIVLLVVIIAAYTIACAPASTNELSDNNARTAATENETPPPPPPPPPPPYLAVTPGTTVINADWNLVPEATSYRVRWRQSRNDFEANDSVIVTDNTATFDVRDQGLWVVLVESCNEAGCGKGTADSTPVIINIPGHLALRVWFDFPETDADRGNATQMNLDWDPLPGHYLVKYRLSGNINWVTSDPLSGTGYSISEDDIKALGRGGHPIVRVYFNCNEDGEQCTELGRFPPINVQQTTPGGHTMGISPSTRGEIQPTPTAPQDGPTGRSADSQQEQRERDPVTNILRPVSDYTVTHQNDEDSRTYRCISRAAENAWETGIFGDAADAIKRCTITETLEIYLLDPKAVFPDGARCGTRPAKNAEEREIHGDNVKICNAPHPGPDNEDDAGDGDKPTGRSHSSYHQVDEQHLSTWPAAIAEVYDGIDRCDILKLTETFENQNWEHDTWISWHWRYEWRNRVTYAYTVSTQSGADKPDILTRFIERFSFCGWEVGYSPSSPYEALWEYQPEGTTGTHNRLDWRFAGEIRPWYGNDDVTFDGIPIPDCSLNYFGGTANIAVDWEGQHERWRESN